MNKVFGCARKIATCSSLSQRFDNMDERERWGKREENLERRETKNSMENKQHSLTKDKMHQNTTKDLGRTLKFCRKLIDHRGEKEKRMNEEQRNY